ncbi:MAG TPA: hypothetical protein VKW09_04645 [bacterium]|nr:hypothetical protein [bacterium]
MSRVRITDPYAAPGSYRKAQLHCHTTRSDGRDPPRAVLERYRAAGYSFVVFTDHNRVTACDDLNDGAFLALPGVETTIPRPFRPLGPHMGRLGAPGSLTARGAQACVDATVAAGGVVSLHHPTWNGNLGTGRWSLREMLALRGYHLVEISNHHSGTAADVRRWTAVLRHRGPAAPVGAVAADDLHQMRDLDAGWIMAKTAAVAAAPFLTALRSQAFYASTGPAAEFGVRDGAITVETDASLTRFLDATGTVRAEKAGPAATYQPAGNEQFVRAECVGRTPASRTGVPATAWSQAFWISNVASD